MDPFAALGLPVEQPSRMTIVHPITRRPLTDKDGKEAYIEMLSPDSAKAEQFEDMINDKRLNRRGGARSQDLKAEQVDRLVNATTGWYLLGLDGTPLDVPFSPENARKLYSANAMAWLRDQVAIYWADRANFARASSPT